MMDKKVIPLVISIILFLTGAVFALVLVSIDWPTMKEVGWPWNTPITYFANLWIAGILFAFILGTIFLKWSKKC